METLRCIPHGYTCRFKRSELTPRGGEGPVRSAASRLNKEAGKQEFTVAIDEEDYSYLITRE